MPEEAKLEYVQERIKETKRREQTAIAFLLLGIIVALVGFAFWWLGLFGTSGIWIGAFGIILAIIEIIGYAANRHIHSQLVRELETVANAAPTCPRCGKEIPKGTHRFCPFCGSQLTPLPRVKSRRGK